jgi:FlaA1/EpsC-like NDP-sugar epimerase
MIENKTILIFGGTGSLGYELNKKYLNKNIIYNFSRDENKHWEMKIYFNNHKNINFIIGNVSDKNIVSQTIKRINPNIIIIASAMKHIDQCEINTYESIKTNLLGTQNIVDSIENEQSLLTNLKTVVFVSSDKACSPINNYGLCKALSETIMVEKAHYIPNIKFVNVRYGNVLNSRGSIIPLLHKIGKNKDIEYYKLTHEKMTRFVMTLENSVDLIEYAIINGESGDTIIPKLTSMNVKDLIEIFAEKYNKKIQIIGLRSGEKILESLINETQSGRAIRPGIEYTHIKSVITYPNNVNKDTKDYNSKLNPLTKEELKKYLQDLGLLDN